MALSLKVSPCKDCKEREIGCSCGSYKAWKKQKQEAKASLMTDREKAFVDYWRQRQK